MTTFHVTSDFPVGTAGSVIFRRKEWLQSVSEGIIPPADVTATLAGSPPSIDQVLRASEETGVSPDFTYEVFIRLTGHAEMKGRLYLTANADLGTAIVFTTPADPALFVTKAEFEDLQATLGDPASAADLEALEAVVDQDIADLADEEARALGAESALNSAITANATAISNEVTRAEAAEDDLDGRVTTLEGAGGGGGSGSGALATVIHYPVIQSVNASGSSADVDSTHLKITFDAPASGNVIIQLQAVASLATGDAFAWGVSDHGSFSDEAQIGYVAGGTQICATRPLIIEGLTPGDPYTFFWTHRHTFGPGTDVTVWGGEAGAAIMQVYEAP